MIGKLRRLIGKLFRKEREKEPIQKKHVSPLAHISLPVKRQPKKAVHQDLNKFFRGKGGKGFVARKYRKTILQKKKVEEE